MTRIFNQITDAIGKTPMVKLQKIVGPNDATVLVKCEYLNPSGSIKDRLATYILDKALASGELKPGGLIIENTSGNTGAGVAQWGAVHGFRCIFTIPDKMSTEKINTLKAFGAEVIVTPTNVPADSPDSYYETAKRLVRENPGSFYLNQYHNKANIEAHYNTTGAEVWSDTDGKIDYFVAGIGTGGTMSGAGKFLKEKNPKIKNVAADPIGSVFYSLFKTGKMSQPHVYKVEGIGEDMTCGALDFGVIDDIMQIDDQQSFSMARRLAREEGLLVGGSSGSAVHVAVELAKKVGKDKTIVVILPDGGKSYISKFYSDEWMVDNGFALRTEGGTVRDVLATKGQKQLLTIRRNQTIGEAITMLRERGISQLPVLDDKGQSVGLVHEIDLLDTLLAGEIKKQDLVERVTKPLQGVISPDASLDELKKVFSDGLVAIVKDGDRIISLITKIDLIEFASRRSK